MNLDNLKFPIGQFSFPEDCNQELVVSWIETIASFPMQLKQVVGQLSCVELNWKYRPEGWCIKQVVHHLADSHMNALIRIKLALTEDSPVIRPYEEGLWAQLSDGLNDDISASLKIIEGVHIRWSQLLENLTEKEWNKTYFHPQHQRLFSVKEGLGIYQWHCNHHLAHIRQALNNKGEFEL
ncbi:MULTISPECIES: YfiT family bacillithiol transferase [unclassified Flavobacterium]|uniref:YfiT family bacillithiol transferase n=1 Tax=unclassified Flavobacterium TaxID=196869 RepID=UPI00361AEB89